MLNYPFLKTTRAWDRATYDAWKALGYEAVNFQVQNDATTKDIDFGPAKQAGLRAEAWGVSYRAGDFFRDGKLLGQQAVRLGAQDVTMNCELAAKDTRNSRGLKPIVDGVRAGGWTGRVNLNTYGAPVNPLVNDFAMDTESFLETGGGVAVQAYLNAYPEYHPALCAQYWLRFVPKDRLNLTLGLYDPSSESGRPQIPGRDYATILQGMNWGRGISIFLPETMLPADLQELAVITKAPPPPPPPLVNPAVNRLEAIALLDESVEHWRKSGVSEATVNLQRQALAWRVLHVVQSGANLKALRDLLDSQGAPRP